MISLLRIALALFALTLLPGIPLGALLLRRVRDGLAWLPMATTLGLVWSVFATLILTGLRIPLTVPTVLAAGGIPLVVVLAHRGSRQAAWAHLRALQVSPATTLVAVLTILALALPLRTVQRGLPTGDVQKSLYWAQRILETRALPNYQDALTLNRDPVDFAIPGLHTLTAALVAVAGEPFRASAWFSLLAAVTLAGLAASFASILTGQRPGVLPVLAFLLAATNLRFLRYTAAPGYHYQNLVGELFLLTSFLFLLMAVAGRGGLRFVALAALTAAALPIVHQFSAFLGAFLLPATFLLLVLKYRREVASLVSTLNRGRRRALLAGLLFVTGAVGWALVSGPLRDKLPHLFSPSPHLRPHVVQLASVPDLLGAPFVLLGIAGILVLLVRLRRRELEWRFWLVLWWIVLLFALSQGARAFLDIPSARTLFYLVTPLALMAALAVATAADRVRVLWPRSSPLLLPMALALALAPTAGNALNTALQDIDHSLQANATLTPATLELLAWLETHPPRCSRDEDDRSDRSTSYRSNRSDCPNAILIDDWNRRRTTWAILSPYRMLTRVGADLAVIAREAGQSDQRRTQYENLLDFEKIYALGNTPHILPLLARHGIAYVVGVRGLSEDVFAHNPALQRAYDTPEVVVFEPKSSQFPVSSFPFREHTVLANDIGDAEDVFAHLPLSVLAPQISAALTEDARTARDITSAVSSIGLNVGAYLPHRWDADGDRMVDAPVELVLWATGNGARGRISRGTLVFTEFWLPTDAALHVIRATIPEGELPIDEQGLAFVTLRLDRGPLRLDLAAARRAPFASP